MYCTNVRGITTLNEDEHVKGYNTVWANDSTRIESIIDSVFLCKLFCFLQVKFLCWTRVQRTFFRGHFLVDIISTDFLVRWKKKNLFIRINPVLNLWNTYKVSIGNFSTRNKSFFIDQIGQNVQIMKRTYKSNHLYEVYSTLTCYKLKDNPTGSSNWLVSGKSYFQIKWKNWKTH